MGTEHRIAIELLVQNWTVQWVCVVQCLGFLLFCSLQVIYFDVLGLFVVVYPERVGVVLNLLTVLVAVVTVWDASRRGSEWKEMCVLGVQKTVSCVLCYEMECVAH